jgi:endonuclease G
MKAPENIERGAKSRVLEATEQRTRVLEAVRRGRPLEAEDEEERKVRRIQRVARIAPEQAARIASYDDGALALMDGTARRLAERIQGKTVDFVGAAFLDLARAAANAVGRVVFRDRRPQGSGFMVSDRLFLTNNHVIDSKESARQFLVEFNYELDGGGQPKSITRFELDPEAFFVTSHEDKLDFTLVAIGVRQSGPATLREFGHCPLIGGEDRHMLGEYVNLVQHPEGEFKQLVLRENRLVTRLETVLHYMADTMPGSSGSPVFNDQWEVVALHHWGEPYAEERAPDGAPLSKEMNEGIRISAILRELDAAKGGLDATRRALLEGVLAGRTGEAAPPVPAPELARRPVEVERGDATLIIPLEVTVRVGGAGVAVGVAAPQAPREPAETAAERIQIDRKYSNRSGYDPDFLQGNSVALPKLTQGQKAKAGRRKQVAQGEDPFELKYEHFSVVVNAERRMAYFTAVNIDGATWRDVDRKTGEPREAAEAAEEWFDDPRLDEDAQTAQDLYDKQLPKRVFDRGHLVRRQDPGWGSAARAKRANADTFHFTNCVPQESLFNQRAQYWQGIEKYVLENATEAEERVSVFTGPVFGKDDPDYRYVKVPMSFWKILARVEGGKLRATALLADQTERIKRFPERAREGFDDLGDVAQYQTSVKEIEKLTGLNFGPLAAADTWQQGPESVGGRRRLGRIEDVRL